MQTRTALIPKRNDDGSYSVADLIPDSDVPDGMRAKIISIWHTSVVHAGFVFRSGDTDGAVRFHLSTEPFARQCLSGHFFVGEDGKGVQVENRTAGALAIEVEFDLVPAS